LARIRTFDAMRSSNLANVLVEKAVLASRYLERDVTVEFFLPKNVEDPASVNLLLINDGQNMEELGLEKILNELFDGAKIQPLFCAAIHAGIDRRKEYGVASTPDYLGRGDKAAEYSSFIRKELIPYIQKAFELTSFKETALAGFSLGGLSAMDMVWRYPEEFRSVGVFSGSFWWRSLDQNDPAYDDDQHRIIHQLIRKGDHRPGLRFFFQCGNMDESMDRNNNGIIDSIDDTLDLIRELVQKGYNPGKDIFYLEFADGRHDIATWARAMPIFLEWGWGTK
jgi:enterochelin esterase-like enzyme